MDFFSQKYDREPVRTDVLFGIVDREGEPYARTTANPADNPWDAIVKNPSSQILHFIPIDKNIVKRKKNNVKSSCDGLLHKVDNSFIAFVEIKNRRKSDFAHACKQLTSTISLFAQNHNVKDFSKRFAFVADHKHPKFQFSHKSDMNEFRSKYGFRLLYQNTVEVK